MDWNLFWNAFGAIGGTVGALATTGAIVVALWQTKIAYQKKVKLSINENCELLSENWGVKSYIGVTIANAGNRDVVIQRWGYELEDGTIYVIERDLSLAGRFFQPQLPHKLALEECITLYYDKKLFLDIMSELIEKGKVNENKMVKFYVEDGTGGKYVITTNKTIRELLTKIEKVSKTIYT